MSRNGVSRSLPNDPVALNSRSYRGRWHPVYSTTSISPYRGNRDRRTEVILVPGHIGSAGRLRVALLFPTSGLRLTKPFRGKPVVAFRGKRSSRHVTQQSVTIAVASTYVGERIRVWQRAPRAHVISMRLESHYEIRCVSWLHQSVAPTHHAY